MFVSISNLRPSSDIWLRHGGRNKSSVFCNILKHKRCDQPFFIFHNRRVIYMKNVILFLICCCWYRWIYQAIFEMKIHRWCIYCRYHYGTMASTHAAKWWYIENIEFPWWYQQAIMLSIILIVCNEMNESKSVFKDKFKLITKCWIIESISHFTICAIAFWVLGIQINRISKAQVFFFFFKSFFLTQIHRLHRFLSHFIEEKS